MVGIGIVVHDPSNWNKGLMAAEYQVRQIINGSYLCRNRFSMCNVRNVINHFLMPPIKEKFYDLQFTPSKQFILISCK
ncbi:hypothetical protein SAMN05216389_10162 [Oceanobacillus limi]|uniref:Uncharacterized protein n=1 Tax=Oceanobacillus limi TaxID=930131 RepID=A0A1H9Y014_9BACI|nr:hypothetical protein SAMN05216389_10162 [Oceanobacillus limi]